MKKGKGMQDQLNRILEEAKSQLEKAHDRAQTEEIRVKVLGKKGELTQILRGMGKLRCLRSSSRN